MPSEKVLILRSCQKNGESYEGFKYPQSGWVETPDWNADPEINCGQGLHGLLWGEGNAELLATGPDYIGQVIEVDPSDMVMSAGGGKVRFRGGMVTTFPTIQDAARYIYDNGGAGKAIVFLSLTGGYRSTLTGGYGSTLTGGDWSTLTGGYRSTLIFRHWDGSRYRFVIGYVGESGIEPNKPYQLDNDNKITGADHDQKA